VIWQVKAAVAFGVVALMGAAAFAQDVTGDFRVKATSYLSDVALVAGSVNHGAIQSGKSAQVEFVYSYTFTAEKEVVIPGETSTVLIFVPGKCAAQSFNANSNANDSACFYTSGQNAGQKKNPLGPNWVGTTEEQTVTTPDTVQVVTMSANGSGLTAIYEPIVVKGRINPKGKLTGYDWSATTGISASPTIVDPSLVPEGYVITSVMINDIQFTAYLVDRYGVVIPDTVVAGTTYISGN